MNDIIQIKETDHQSATIYQTIMLFPVFLHIYFVGLSVATCRSTIYGKTSRNSESMKIFTDDLYEIWGSQSFPIDLSQLSTSVGSEWLTAITNFMNLDLMGVSQPVLLRYPVPSVIKFEAAGQVKKDIGWILEDTIGSVASCNSSLSGTGSLLVQICAAFDVGRLTIKHKPWNWQLRVDLFPPHLATSKFLGIPDEIHRHFEGVSFHNVKFRLPFLWSVNISRSLLSQVLVGRVPIVHITMFPYERWRQANQKQRALMPWADNAEYTYVFHSTNVQFFMADLVGSSRNTYVPGSVWYVNPQQNNEIVKMEKQLSPENIFKLLEQIWNSEMRFGVAASWKMVQRQFATCDNRGFFYFGAVPNEQFSAEGVISLALVSMWQSILKNYSYAIGRVVCSNGKQTGLIGTPFSSQIVVENKLYGRFLHVPMLVRDPVNGYRFVVCGKRGSEGLAFEELVIVYDNFVWVTICACVILTGTVWKLLLLRSSNHRSNLQNYVVSGKVFSLVKIMLEQGELSPGSTSISNQKARLLLGIVLIMTIVLSNGYKNVNVYKMIMPRSTLRYETFNQLIDANASIHTFSKFHNFHTKLIRLNWFSQKISTRSVSNHFYDIMFRYEGAEHKLLRFQAAISDIISNSFTLDFTGKTALQLNKMVYSGTSAFLGNTLASWIKEFKRKHRNWENVTENYQIRTRLLIDNFSTEFEDVERNLMLSLLIDCNKTALVVPSPEAESYTRLLTPDRGNAGKEIYFQEYITVTVRGLVTPPFLARLARMKESGIVEWWANVTEYISIVQFHYRASNSVLRKEGYPTGASLKGNIVVIFTVLMGGHGLAVTAFISEISFRMALRLKNMLDQTLFIIHIH